MAIIPVDRLGEHGLVADMRPHELPLNAWTTVQNCRMKNGFVEKFLGCGEVMATPPVAPYWAMPVPTAAQYNWLYCSLLKAYYYDGAHNNITRQTAGNDVNYAASADLNWTGTVLGGVPVINNGIDVPQQLLPVTAATRLAALSNWPSGYLCGAMRSYKDYLIALDITKSGTNYPFLVLWSHNADPGDIPDSWDITDETRDAGEKDLSESGGFVIDCAVLRDTNIIYKQDEAWGMQYIGGTQIFRFWRLFEQLGILSRRCAVEIGSEHAVFGLNDIVRHDGQNARSILEHRLRDYVYNDIDSDYYKRSFAVANHPYQEVWFCYPESGSAYPSKAVVWNYRTNAVGIRDLPRTYHIEHGQVTPDSSADQWNSAVGDWSSDPDKWGSRPFNPAQKRLLFCIPGDVQFCMGDYTNQEDGSNITAYVERTGMGFPLRKDGPPDYTTMKQLTRLFPRIEGTDSGVIQITFGVQDAIDGAVTWGSSVNFTIGTNQFVDPPVALTGRLHAIKFQSTTNIEWRLHGYDAEIVDRGMYG